MANTQVAIVMGSANDWKVVEHCFETLKEFGITAEVQVMSAHRTPHEACEFAENAAKNGFKVIIGAAGGAAHLAGVLAGHTILPVIGIPMPAWALDGMDSLLSTVQMPKGVPVATVAIGKVGAVNAAILAVQMLALADEELAAKLVGFKQDMHDDVLKSNADLQKQLGK
ncbi:MAG: 5-(carboxyamino)imidazole ribonucleotide mutase [Kiritimatiellales bacterium]|nr:5-(carboxyamino)imidazole ribonucleotide mutase [Kiritimatiellota bacterium]MBL7011728.1 5-(carboxyamino)imidazole ribonucleotide mutase [Kiritimatiellales bacterium]